MIEKVQTGYRPSELEEGIREYWSEAEIYKRVRKARSSCPDFYFVDGPPYTTGSIHLGTALNKTIKDAVIRLKRMQRRNVRDQPGYDMHGLPIEVKVEQSLGVESKKEIEDYGIDKFVSTCKDFALEFQEKMTEQFKRLGVWMDWEVPYMTINTGYVEAAWWTLKRAYDRGLLDSSQRVLSWCPRCETALAEAEIEYYDAKDPSIYVKFPLKDEDVSLLIWTTTPWTLPANMAVAVHPDYDYVKVRYYKFKGESETVIVVKDQVQALGSSADWDEYEILEEMKGEALVGTEYVSPLEREVPQQQQVEGEWVHKVIPSDTVSADNTGLVHIAPGHGPEDFELGQEFNIGPFCPVDEDGKFTEEAGKYSGTFVRGTNSIISKDLDDKGMMFHHTTIEHRYGQCWRCDSPIIYRSTVQWFLRVSEIKELMLEEVERVHWTPDWAGSSRQYDWVDNARDWCISRQRYWGIPLPIWKCGCGEIRVISSLNELKGKEGFREDLEPHRPWIDEVVLECEKCGGKMSRIPDVLDVWFDAAVSSWAQLNFPSEKESFDRWWPAKWISEAHDQTRGWFYSQLAAGCIAFERAPYESVLMHGWVLDSDGQRMSKSRGNVVEPEEVIQEFGVDSLRLYLMKTNAPWEDLSFQKDGVRNARKTLNIFWNIVKFASMYMSIDDFDPESVDYDQLESALRNEDRWMISRREAIKNDVTRFMNSYELHKAARALDNYIVEDISRWYIRLIRDRMWKEEGDVDKLAAYKVLYDSIMTAAKLMAPICPHITEEIYRKMDGGLDSVHMADWPVPDLTDINDRLESSMEIIQELVEVITRERQEVGLKLRWPLKRVVIKGGEKSLQKQLEPLEEVLKSQANVKDIEYVDPEDEWDEMLLDVIPNPNVIGKVYRQWSSKIAVLLKSRSAHKIRENIRDGEYQLGIEGQMIRIEPDMVSFRSSLPPEVVSLDFSKGEMYVDFEVTSEIESEGFTRELIRRIQQMRKDMKLDVEEFIEAKVQAPVSLIEYFKEWKDYIKNETRSRVLDFIESPEGDEVKTWEVEGEEITIAITPLKLKKAAEVITSSTGISQEAAFKLIETGYSTLEDVKNASYKELNSIQGITEVTMRKLSSIVNRTMECPDCGEEASSSETFCPSCETFLRRDMISDEFMEVLLEGGMGEQVIASIIDSGFTSREALMSASEEELLGSGLGDEAIEEVKTFVSESERKRKEMAQLDELTRSYTYLIEEEKSRGSYQLLEVAVNAGIPGFCVTRNYPVKIKSKYDLDDTQMIWLSNIGKEEALRPKDLEKLSFKLEQFISNEKGILLLDGLEYLITNNSFLTVLKFIQSLRDQVAINEAILLLALNPSTLEESQLNLLEKEVDGTLKL